MVGPVQLSNEFNLTGAPVAGRLTGTRKTRPDEFRPEPVPGRENQSDVEREKLEFALEVRQTGVRFRRIDNPNLIQARVIDRNTNEVLREVPTTPRLRFSRAFRKVLADNLGRRIDASA